MRFKSVFKRSGIAAVFAAVTVIAISLIPGKIYAADSGIPEGYEPTVSSGIPHVQMRDVFETDTIEVSGIRIVEEQASLRTDPGAKIKFRIYNTTTQETERVVESVMDGDGKSWLPVLQLKKDHDYIFYVEDPAYQYPQGESYPSASKMYVQVREGDPVTATEGPGAYNYLVTTLRYSKLQEIVVERRESVCADPAADNRYDTLNDSQTPVRVYYKGNIRPGIKFRLVSDAETIETSTDSEGRLDVSLIEGVTYVVYVVSDKYSIDPFPIVAKDKTEYGEGLYCYNHSTCVKVSNITLYDIGDTVFDGLNRTTTLNSLKKRSSVTGMNFKNLLFVDRVLDDKVDALNGRIYELLSFTAVNPTRWEVSKLMGMDFSITWKKAGGRLVSHVYYLKDGKLSEIKFKQTSANDVTFTMDSLSLYPVAIEYNSSKSYADLLAEQADARAKSIRTVTVNSTTVNAAVIDSAVRKAGGSAKYVTKIVLGSKVKTIKAKTFAKYTKVTELQLKTKKLTKKTVKKALQGSKVKTVRVKVSVKSKTNKTYIKKYKKIFTKKIAGKKVSVK